MIMEFVNVDHFCWCIKSIEQRSYTRTCKLNVTFSVFGYPILPAVNYLFDKNCDCDIFNTFLAMLNFWYTYHECVFRTNLPKKWQENQNWPAWPSTSTLSLSLVEQMWQRWALYLSLVVVEGDFFNIMLEFVNLYVPTCHTRLLTLNACAWIRCTALLLFVVGFALICQNVQALRFNWVFVYIETWKKSSWFPPAH